MPFITELHCQFESHWISVTARSKLNELKIITMRPTVSEKSFTDEPQRESKKETNGICIKEILAGELCRQIMYVQVYVDWTWGITNAPTMGYWQRQRLMFYDFAVFDMNISILKGFACKMLSGEPHSPRPTASESIDWLHSYDSLPRRKMHYISYDNVRMPNSNWDTLLIRFSHAGLNVHGSENRNCAKRTNYGNW